MVLSRWAMTMQVRPDHHAAEIVLDRAFGFGVERAGRLVENENWRICIECARDGDALFLSAG